MWIEILQTVAIVVSLLLAAYSFRVSTRVTRFNIQHDLAKSHRELFFELIRDPELARVLDETRELSDLTDISTKERMYVSLLINHTLSVWNAYSAGSMELTEPQRANMAHFFRLPTTQLVWRHARAFHKADFVHFVEELAPVGAAGAFREDEPPRAGPLAP